MGFVRALSTIYAGQLIKVPYIFDEQAGKPHIENDFKGD
jgi:hypothetical protein